MKFRGRFSVPKLDAKKFSEALVTECQTQQKQAAREWLRAVIPKVPVWAGTSRGSLRPLGRFLRVAVPITPVARDTDLRNQNGIAYGASKSSFKFNRRGQRFIFSIDINVKHFIENNFHERPNPPYRLKEPTPWHALEAGQAAYEAYIRNVLPKRIPRIKNFIKFKTQVIE